MDRQRIAAAGSWEGHECLGGVVSARTWMAVGVAGTIPLIVTAYLVSAAAPGVVTVRTHIALVTMVGLLAAAVGISFVRAAMANQEVPEFEEAMAGEAALEERAGYAAVLVEALRAKDAWTFAHCERVAAYARLIAREAGLTAEQAADVWMAGLLHDIGMIGLSDRVLEKRGKLTEEDRRRVAAHPVIGRRILEPCAVLSDLVMGVYHHHEHYDGSGYPLRLKGDEIPLAARIIALADAYDRMNELPVHGYKLSLPEQLSTIEEQAGSRFDPALSPLLIELMQDGRMGTGTYDSEDAGAVHTVPAMHRGKGVQ